MAEHPPRLGTPQCQHGQCCAHRQKNLCCGRACSLLQPHAPSCRYPKHLFQEALQATPIPVTSVWLGSSSEAPGDIAVFMSRWAHAASPWTHATGPADTRIPLTGTQGTSSGTKLPPRALGGQSYETAVQVTCGRRSATERPPTLTTGTGEQPLASPPTGAGQLALCHPQWCLGACSLRDISIVNGLRPSFSKQDRTLSTAPRTPGWGAQGGAWWASRGPTVSPKPQTSPLRPVVPSWLL